MWGIEHMMALSCLLFALANKQAAKFFTNHRYSSLVTLQRNNSNTTHSFFTSPAAAYVQGRRHIYLPQLLLQPLPLTAEEVAEATAGPAPAFKALA